MRSFITGSVCYGKPTKESDVDLVIQMNRNELDQLKKYADSHDMTDCSQGGPDTASLIFGKLNLIVCCTDDAYAIWKAGTIRCTDIRVKERKPMLRDRAVKIFRKLRAKYLGEEFTEEDG